MDHASILDLTAKIALIVGAGMGAQWLGWRLQWPAIVLLSAFGLLLGPVSGLFLPAPLIAPSQDFGNLLAPAIGLAVAVILFEGGLALQFSELRDASSAVRRLVILGAPLGWALNTLAAHFVADLSWSLAALFGGLMVVTGPTVILPLLRQAKLVGRAAAVLKWEGIVNDPVGALFAVAVFEYIHISGAGLPTWHAMGGLLAASLFAALIGFVLAQGINFAFRKGQVPEYLKSPIMLAMVLLVYAGADAIAHETGLVAVTVMGLTLANSPFAAIEELRRFKESVATLLVSSLFIILTAGLQFSSMELLDARMGLFVLVMLFVVRPAQVFLATMGTGLSWQEKLLTGWIAPRGIVAVAVAGYFATQLGGQASVLAPLAFLMVFATVLAHGFTIGPLAKMLGLTKHGPEGVLIVGANPWTRALVARLHEMQVPVILADTNWRRLREARLAGIPVYHGEVLAEAAEHRLDHAPIDWLLAASGNDAYNALVCVEYAPELGRHRVVQIAAHDEDEAEHKTIHFTSRGRTSMRRGRTMETLIRDYWAGWRFRMTELTEEYDLQTWRDSLPEGAEAVAEQRPNGEFSLLGPNLSPKGGVGARLLGFVPPDPETRDQSSSGT